MIHTVGFEFEGLQTSTIESAINYLELCNVCGLDIETTRKFKGIYGKREGLDPYVTNIVMIQIGDLNRQYIIDARKIPSKWITLMFEKITDRKIPLVGHNLKFEFKHIYHNYKVEIDNLIDTQIMEAIIVNGFPQPLSLKYVIKKYLNEDVDKDIRMSFLQLGNADFNIHQIMYGADDIILPLKFYNTQLNTIKNTNQLQCFKLEMKFLRVLAMMEYNGFNIDVDRWKELIVINDKKFEDQEKLLKQMLIDYLPDDSPYIDKQLDLFSSETKLNVSFSSTKQCIPMFKSIGIDCKTVSKSTSLEVNTLESKVLKTYLVVNAEMLEPEALAIIKAYMKLKEYEKSCQTYGQSFLDNYVHPITGRLHSNFKQIVSTGRMSSSEPNIQNIPAAKEYRICFTANDEGELINADYSGQENYILVNQSLDPDLLEFYRGEENDMHAFIASKIFPKLHGMSLKDIKAKHPDLRNTAKSAGFAIAYGGNGFTISANIGISEAEGEFLYNSYFKAFPGLREYYDKLIAKSLAMGYILIDPVTGRRRNFKKPTNKKEEGAIGRKCLNSPVQGVAGSMTKLALVILDKAIKQAGLFDIIKITNVVHDEVMLESFTKDENILKQAASLLEKAMVDAANVFCTTVPLKADAVITDHWQH